MIYFWTCFVNYTLHSKLISCGIVWHHQYIQYFRWCKIINTIMMIFFDFVLVRYHWNFRTKLHSWKLTNIMGSSNKVHMLVRLDWKTCQIQRLFFPKLSKEIKVWKQWHQFSDMIFQMPEPEWHCQPEDPTWQDR